MDNMFNSCNNLISINIGNWNTNAVVTMDFMFTNCTNLESVDISAWNTNTVTSMLAMFSGCNNLTTIKTGTNFKFVDTNYQLPGLWQNTAGETFYSGTFPSNVADTYTKIS